jgi:hypothetical protein
MTNWRVEKNALGICRGSSKSFRMRILLTALSVLIVSRAVVVCGADAQQGALRKMDLRSEARIYASHATPGEEFKIENAIDGDPETKWVGEAHPLSFQPANIVIEFPAAQKISRIALLSTIFRERLALKDVELYARVENGWAGATPLKKAVATNVLTTIDFLAIETTALRIRIRDTWREDHSYPRIHEIELYRAPETDRAQSLQAGAIQDEKASERAVLRRALGERYVPPGTKFDPAKGYIGYVREFIDTMMREGTDRYGTERSPMFASLLDMESHAIPDDIPANIEGQRYGDRALRGGNLLHDVMLLQTCGLLAERTQEPKYGEARNAYLTFFLKRSPQKTGLFPWGEHAYWDFFEEKPGASIHEFLGSVPHDFWEILWRINPEAVRREMEGLINHVTNLRDFHFDRHADLFTSLPESRTSGGGMDFPRHAGFYIQAWGFLYSKTPEKKYADWILQMIGHHWPHRDKNGILPSTTRGAQAQIASVESTLSLGVSLLETAAILPPGEIRERCQSAGEEYTKAVVRLPHRAREGKFLASMYRKPPAEIVEQFSDPYRYGYGGNFTADNASLLLAVHRLTGNQSALKLAEELAAFYARNDPPPPYEVVRAHVYASIIGLFTDLYSLRKDPAHLAQAERHAELAIERLYYKGLFRGATGIDHYEGDLMPGNLAYNLVWLDTVKSKGPLELKPNYFNR